MTPHLKQCRNCKHDYAGNSLICLPDMPGAAQNLPESEQAAFASATTLDVWQCPDCGLVQLANNPVPYYKNVIRAGSISPSMRKRQYQAFQDFIGRFSLQRKKILEIGSGRGEYLSILKELPVTVVGMEHNPEFCKIANENGLNTIQAFPSDLSRISDDLIFDAFISINFLEHIPDPSNFLKACANLIAEDGVGMIAVPDFEFELEENFLFSFMSDHLLYFTTDSLRNTVSLNGFEVIELFKNKKLNVVTAYVKKRRPPDLSLARHDVEQIIRKIEFYIDANLEEGKRVALWGASHLAFSVLAGSGIKDKIAYFVDSAPFKQNRFSPASAIKIFPPQHLFEEPVQVIVIFCPEYSAEIVADIKNRFSDVVEDVATFVNGDLEIVK